MPGQGERLLPLLSAVLLALSFPPFHLLVAPFAALVPFALFVEGTAWDGDGAGAAARGGLLLGVVYFGLLLWWLLPALWEVTPAALLAWPAMVAVLGILTAGVGWTLQRLRRRAEVPLWLALPLAWTAGEWIRSHLPGGLAFPWLGLGSSLTGFPRLVGIAELVGARGVTFWIALVAGLAATLVGRLRSGRRWAGPVAALLLTWTLPAAWGVWRAKELPMRPTARVAVVQTEVPQEVRFHPDRAVDRSRRELAGLEPGPDSAAPDLVVWPETVFPVVLRSEEGRVALRYSREAASRMNAPVLVGAFDSLPGEARRFNAAVLVDSGGPSGFVYRKRRLVPVVESAPAGPFSGLFHGPGGGGGEARGLRPGSDAPVATATGGGRFGVLVCYESAFPGLARGYRVGGAEFLVNVTNDAWFGGPAGTLPTTGLWQHPAHLVMRAVEERMGVARAANGGFSLFVDPIGRTYGRAPLGRPALRVRTVFTTDVRTLYSRTGDLVGPGSVLAALLLVLVTWPPSSAGASADPAGRAGRRDPVESQPSRS